MSTDRKNKRKKWLKNKQIKVMRQLRRRNKDKRLVYKGSVAVQKKGNFEHRIVAPEKMSLSDDPSETAKFFVEVFSIIHKCRKNQSIYFDLSNVKIVTVDAIMYLIAVISNSKIIRALEITCRGNMPLYEKAKLAFEKVGFYDHVRSVVSKKIVKFDDRITIRYGKESDGVITSSICDFVNKKNNSDSNQPTKRLYPMLVELMTNVKQHAYKENSGNMSSRWYVYVEDCEKFMKFVFLDTGVGIPTTIRKNWSERIKDGIKDLFGGDKDDPVYIEAALNGEFRTETKQEHRGKGLPEIKNAIMSKEGRLNNLMIVSGHGICTLDKTGPPKRKYLDIALEGTLFIWYFEKEVSVND